MNPADPRPASSSALPVLGRRERILGEWNLARVTGMLPAGVALRLERPDGAWLQLTLASRGKQALVETKFGALAYGTFEGLTRDEVVSTARAFATVIDSGALPIWSIFPHLSLESRSATDDRSRIAGLLSAQVRGLLPGATTSAPDAESLLPVLANAVVFDPPGLAELLAPELTVDAAPVAGYVLHAIYLPPVGKRATADIRAFVLDFAFDGPAGDDALPVVRLKLSIDPQDEGIGRAGPLSVSVMGFTGDVDALPSRTMSLASWVLTLLRAKLSESTPFRIAANPSELRALSVPADRSPDKVSQGSAPLPGKHPQGTPPALNLAIDAECGQACVFCSVKSYVRPSDGGDAELAQLQQVLRQAREQGVEEVRLNGIDPLGFSKVLDVVSIAKSLGFRRLSVFSPSRKLADPRFRKTLLDNAPPERTITVPLYGVTPAVHDAVTGTPGAFQQVRAAIDGLMADGGPGVLALSTVIVKQNVHEFPEIVAFARERGLRLESKFAYPMRQTTRDPYAEAAIRESEVIDHFIRSGRFQPAHGDNLGAWAMLSAALVHPCVAWSAEQRTKLPIFGALPRTPQNQILAGTEYRSSSFVHAGSGSGVDDAFSVATQPCAHAADCALASNCPKEHYTVYLQRFGDDEFKPVTTWDLYTRGAHPLVREQAFTGT